MLSDRRQRVLAALIEEYVARALPVGSRTLTERYNLGVSSATVRNELSVLEEEGYISQPHTSAGRIPTDFGYRAFVDKLLESEPPTQDERYREAVDRLKSSATELDDLLEQTSSALARLTDCLSIVIAPSAMSLQIRQVTLISLSDTRAILVLVTKDGQVFNRQMDFAQPIAADELARVQRVVNKAFGDNNLAEVEGLRSADIEVFEHDPLLRMVTDEIIDCLEEHALSRAHRLGMSSLMKKPEFQQSQSLLPIMQVLEDDTILLQVLDTSDEKDGKPVVKIGSENETEQLSGVSVIASQYGRGDAAGIVAVIGPTRMNYSKVLQAVRLASDALQDD